MKKKHSILLIYGIYIVSLFGLSIYYQDLDESSPTMNFATSFSRSLGSFTQFFWFSFFVSWLFVAVVFFIHKKLSFAFILLTPLFLFFIGLLVFLLADFVLWISQWRPDLSDYQELFLLASVSTTILTVWIFADVFRNSENRNIKNV